jgi:MoxR-like ATPase
MTTTLTPSTLSSLSALRGALRASFYERETEIDCLLLALLAEEHVLLLGDPGVGKSALVNALTAALSGSRSFGLLFTRFTVPEEVFGPISLKGLENDSYRRVTAGYLPEAEVAFLDEIFKAGSPILNALLTLLNERAFDNGGTRSKCPLKIAIGASNELPENASLDALYDRFVLRRWVEPIKSRSNLRALLMSRGEPTSAASISDAQLADLRTARGAVRVTDDTLDALLDCKDALARINAIEVSDRRWRKILKVVQASAILHGRIETERSDILPIVDAIWRKPEERAAIFATISQIAQPDLAEATRLGDAAMEQYRAGCAGLEQTRDADTNKAAQGLIAARNARRELKKIAEEARKLPTAGKAPAVDGEIRRIEGFMTGIAERLLQQAM